MGLIDQHHQPVQEGDVLVVIRSGQLRMCQISSFSPCGYPMVKFWNMARDKFIAPIYQLQTSKFIKINYQPKTATT